MTASLRLLSLLALMCAPLSAHAADVRVLASLAVTTTLEKVIPEFERASGHKASVTLSTATAIKKQMEAGEAPADLVIISEAAIDDLIAATHLVAASRAPIATTGTGVVVRSGAPKPDISSPETLKAALQAAKSVAYTAPARGGTSGVHFAKVLDQLGIRAEVDAKAVLVTVERVGEVIARGDAELGVHTIAELMPVKGIDYVGPLPDPLQNRFALTAAIPVNAAEPAAAQALIDMLRGPIGVRAIIAGGLKPGA